MADWRKALKMLGQQAKEDTPQAPTPARPQVAIPTAPVEQVPLPEGFGLSPTGGDSAIPYYVAAPGTTPEEIASTRREVADTLWNRGLSQPATPSIPAAYPHVAGAEIDAALEIAQAYGLDLETDRETLQALLKYRELTNTSPNPLHSSPEDVKRLLEAVGAGGKATMPDTVVGGGVDWNRGGATPIQDRDIRLLEGEVADPRNWPGKAEEAQQVRDKQTRLKEIQQQLKELTTEYETLTQ